MGVAVPWACVPMGVSALVAVVVEALEGEGPGSERIIASVLVLFMDLVLVLVLVLVVTPHGLLDSMWWQGASSGAVSVSDSGSLSVSD